MSLQRVSSNVKMDTHGENTTREKSIKNGEIVILKNQGDSMSSEEIQGEGKKTSNSPYLDARLNEIPQGYSGRFRILATIVGIDGNIIQLDDGTGILSANIGRNIEEGLLKEGATVRAFVSCTNLKSSDEVIWVDILQDFTSVDREKYWQIVKWERSLKGFPSIKNQQGDP